MDALTQQHSLTQTPGLSTTHPTQGTANSAGKGACAGAEGKEAASVKTQAIPRFKHSQANAAAVSQHHGPSRGLLVVNTISPARQRQSFVKALLFW